MSAAVIGSGGGAGHVLRCAWNNTFPKHSAPQRGQGYRPKGLPPRWRFRLRERRLADNRKISASSISWPQDSLIRAEYNSRSRDYPLSSFRARKNLYASVFPPDPRNFLRPPWGRGGDDSQDAAHCA